MKKITFAATALDAAGALALSGCSGGARGSDTGEASDGAEFAADSTIGIALPDKASENRVLAGGLFEDGLEEFAAAADGRQALPGLIRESCFTGTGRSLGRRSLSLVREVPGGI